MREPLHVDPMTSASHPCLVRAAIAMSLALVASPPVSHAQSIAFTREFFYVGGQYTSDSGSAIMTGQMYVEVLRPANVTQRVPLVMIHGNWQTATNWIQTPDGRQGWADYFLAQGFVLYLVDQPGRGRSPWHSSTMGAQAPPPVSSVERQFTSPASLATWPQAKLHTQWPGADATKGRRGDAVFDAFYASHVESIQSATDTQLLMKVAGSALLDRIGPAILLTHSQSGPLGWVIADARPTLVKAIVAVEPGGPPFQNAVTNDNPSRAWGITDIPVTYDPPIRDAAELRTVREVIPQSPDLAPCTCSTGAGKAPRSPRGCARARCRDRGVVPCCVRPLHSRVFVPGWRANDAVAPRGTRHSRQRPHGDVGEEQHRCSKGVDGMDLDDGAMTRPPAGLQRCWLTSRWSRQRDRV